MKNFKKHGANVFGLEFIFSILLMLSGYFIFSGKILLGILLLFFGSKLEEMKTFYLQKKVKFSDLSVWLKAVVVFGWIMLTIWMLILMLDVVVFMR